MIKLLRGQSQKVDISDNLQIGEKKVEFSLAFDVVVVDSALQARLQDLALIASSQSGRQKYIAFVLNNCIEGDCITINDSDMVASEVAKMADFGDPTTIGILSIVCREVDKCVFISDEEAKK